MSLDLFDVVAALVVLGAVFGLLNHHVLRLPFTIGLTVSGLAAAVAVAGLDRLVPELGLGEPIRLIMSRIDFSESLMHGMLGFLLFAGALHVDLDDLLQQKGPILSLASVGVVVSTALIGLGSWLVFSLVGAPVPLPWCLVFGALISPTDPIAVLGIMKSAGAPKSLEIKVTGESLFNDGIGVVVFSLLVAAASGRAGTNHATGAGVVSAVLGVFLLEVVGGVLLGLVAGYLAYRGIASIAEPNLEVLLSVALVMGVTFAAFQLHASAPLACVVAGLLIGNHGRRFGMTAETRQALDIVWSFLDEAMNAVLFLLVGLEVVALTLDGRSFLATVLLVPLALGARFVSVLLPISVLRLRRSFSPGVVRILTWGGLRGGISVALALSLPPFEGRDAILFATYGIVIFSLLVQGLTIGTVIRRLVPAETGE